MGGPYFAQGERDGAGLSPQTLRGSRGPTWAALLRGSIQQRLALHSSGSPTRQLAALTKSEISEGAHTEAPRTHTADSSTSHYTALVRQ